MAIGFSSVGYALDMHLLQAIQNRDVAGVKCFLETRASHEIVMQADAYGWTALHVACLLGYDDIVALLLDGNSSLEFLMKADHQNGWTALHVASDKGHKKVVKLLLLGWASVSLDFLLSQQTYDDGFIPLDRAYYHGHLDIVKCLVSHAPFLLSKNGSGNVALGIAFKSKKYNVAYCIVKKMRELGIFFNPQLTGGLL